MVRTPALAAPGAAGDKHPGILQKPKQGRCRNADAYAEMQIKSRTPGTLNEPMEPGTMRTRTQDDRISLRMIHAAAFNHSLRSPVRNRPHQNLPATIWAISFRLRRRVGRAARLGVSGFARYPLRKPDADNDRRWRRASRWSTASDPVVPRVVVQFAIHARAPADLLRRAAHSVFLAGMALAMVFDLRRARRSLYFADLIGAPLGALGVTFLLQAGRRSRGHDRGDPRRAAAA